MTTQIILTLIVLNICHWLGDFTHLSTNWMLSAKRLGKPIFPILIHALVHSLLFYIAIYIMYNAESAMIGGLVQLTTHSMIDIWKGKMNAWFPKLQDISNKFHWWIFGIDQMLHHFVIILIVFMIN